jgi:hypothetical protein
MNEPLKAVSNVIELKPDHKYLLVVSGENVTDASLQEITRMLNEQRIGGVIIHLAKGQSLEVIEAPEKS